MKRIAAIVAALFLVVVPSASAAGFPALARPYSFAAGFDPGCQLLGSNGGWDSLVTDTGGSVAIENSEVGSGYCSAKFQTPSGSSQSRAELARHSVSTPVTVDYEWLEYIPSSPSVDHGVLQQTKMNNNPCYNGGLTKDKNNPDNLNWSTVGNCSAGSVKHDLGPIPYDQWFGVHVVSTFSDSGHAFVQVDPDGYGPLPYVTKLDVATDTLSGSGLKLRLGLYHDEDPHVSFVYGDAFHLK